MLTVNFKTYTLCCPFCIILEYRVLITLKNKLVITYAAQISIETFCVVSANTLLNIIHCLIR